MSEEPTTQRQRAFCIEVRGEGNAVNAYLAPPDGKVEADAPVLASINSALFAEPEIREAFEAFLATIGKFVLRGLLSEEQMASVTITKENRE